MYRLFTISVMAFVLLVEGDGFAEQVTDNRRDILVSHIINGACFRDAAWQKYCLAGVRVPLMAPITEEGDVEPFAIEARDLLYQYLFNRKIRLTILDRKDRWGTEYVVISDLVELEGPLQYLFLSRGLAYVAEKPEGLNEKLYDGFRVSQQKARNERLNIWQSSRFKILAADNAVEGLGQYRYVRGKVLSTAVTRDRVYLNFGPDYKTDFTITIESPLYRAWSKEGFDVSIFDGREVEVYGRLKSINGPSLALTDKSLLTIINPVNREP